MESNNVKPFVKWVGGKTRLLNTIRELYPSEIDSYCEPFVGGGAVLLDILSIYKPNNILINDMNKELINVYQCIKYNVVDLISELSQIQDEYYKLTEEEQRRYYSKIRMEYNRLQTDIDKIRKAVLFIFLNKTCYNGLYRVNSKNYFNVPRGSYDKPLICDTYNLLELNGILQNVEMKVGDYYNCLSFITSDTFVYLDPPYRPISNSSSFVNYTDKGFDNNEQLRLHQFVTEINNIGAKFMMSNSDPKNINAYDDFFDTLYGSYNIKRVLASRSISCNADTRMKIKEIIVLNY